MATEVLLCDSVGQVDNWTLAAGASKVAAVAGDDGDTSYVNSGTTADTVQEFALAVPATIPVGSTINSVTVRATTKRNGSDADWEAQINLQGVGSQAGSTQTATNVYALVTEVFARPTGGAWTLADLNIPLRLQIKNLQARDVRLTHFDVVVDFTPPTNIRATQFGVEPGIVAVVSVRATQFGVEVGAVRPLTSYPIRATQLGVEAGAVQPLASYPIRATQFGLEVGISSHPLVKMTQMGIEFGYIPSEWLPPSSTRRRTSGGFY